MFQWAGEGLARAPGESALEDLTDAPGLALLYAPLMLGGLAFTLAALALGVESLIRGEDGNAAKLGVGFGAFVLVLTGLTWVLHSAVSGA